MARVAYESGAVPKPIKAALHASSAQGFPAGFHAGAKPIAPKNAPAVSAPTTAARRSGSTGASSSFSASDAKSGRGAMLSDRAPRSGGRRASKSSGVMAVASSRRTIHLRR